MLDIADIVVSFKQ